MSPNWGLKFLKWLLDFWKTLCIPAFHRTTLQVVLVYNTGVVKFARPPYYYCWLQELSQKKSCSINDVHGSNNDAGVRIRRERLQNDLQICLVSTFCKALLSLKKNLRRYEHYILSFCTRIQIFKTKTLSHKPYRLNYKDLSNNGVYSKAHTQHIVWLNAVFSVLK